jgi:lysophospholipase L1-like esterase
MGGYKMKQEKVMEMMQNKEIRELIDTFFFGFMDSQKKNRLISYKQLNQVAKKGQILFVGSSLMEQFPINELQQALDKNYIIYNRGIGGYVTSDLLNTMEECIFELQPSKIFINIGTNDIGSPDYKKEKLISNYDNILTQISDRLPQCEVYVIAYYPVNAKASFPGVDEARKESMFKTRTNSAINEVNLAVQELARKHKYIFINVNEGLTDEEGDLKEEYAVEGLHMWPNAYQIVLKNMKKYL